MSAPIESLGDPRLRQRALYTHWVNEHVRWSDTDMVGHANNLAFAAFCETGRAHLLRPFLIKGSATPALLVLGELRLRYLGEAHWPAMIDVGTCVLSIGKRSCSMGQALFDGERCIAVAESLLVLIDETTRKSRDITGKVHEILAGYGAKLAAVGAATDDSSV